MTANLKAQGGGAGLIIFDKSFAKIFAVSPVMAPSPWLALQGNSTMPHLYMSTGQTHCYDTWGREVACQGTGQDAEYSPGAPWPVPRFEALGASARDRLTGLQWTTRANFGELPVPWSEALDVIRQMNRNQFEGYGDWRLPNRRELRSLISYQTRDPALPSPHPFRDVFLGWYWTSTTAAINPAYAWYVHLEGGRTFYGRKSEFRLFWPVRGKGIGILPATGQRGCFDVDGRPVECRDTGQDGELRMGFRWPDPRFEADHESVKDHLTGLVWTRSADLARRWTTWDEAFQLLTALNAERFGNRRSWSLPTINELESLVDASRHTPALPNGHPFHEVQEAYWSSTSSGFEPDWCMALYMHTGAVGVGQKKDENFSVWAVSREA